MPRADRLAAPLALPLLLCCTLACAGAPTVRGQRGAFAHGGSSLLAAVDGERATVYRVPGLSPLWSRAFPLVHPDRLHAEPSGSGRLLIAHTGRRLWVASQSGALLLDLPFDADDVALDLKGSAPRALYALSPDERWLALAWQRTLQLYRLPEAGDLAPPERVYLPLAGALAGYPRCAGGEEGRCGVLSVSFSAGSDWLLALHRPAESQAAAAMLRVWDGPSAGAVEVPVRPDRGPDAAFLGGSSEVLFERFGALRIFSPPALGSSPAETAPRAPAERDAPGDPPATCNAAAACLGRTAPVALCAGSGEAVLRDLRSGAVLARSPLVLGQATKELVGAQTTRLLSAAADGRAAVLLPDSGEVLLLRRGEAAFTRWGSIGPRLPPPRSLAPPLPAAFSDDARAILWLTDPEHLAAALLW